MWAVLNRRPHSKLAGADGAPDRLQGSDLAQHKQLFAGLSGIPVTADSCAYEPIQKLLALGTSDGRIKIFGQEGVERVVLSTRGARGTRQLQFLLNRGVLLRVCRVGARARLRALGPFAGRRPRSVPRPRGPPAAPHRRSPQLRHPRAGAAGPAAPLPRRARARRPAPGAAAAPLPPTLAPAPPAQGGTLELFSVEDISPHTRTGPLHVLQLDGDEITTVVPLKREPYLLLGCLSGNVKVAMLVNSAGAPITEARQVRGLKLMQYEGGRPAWAALRRPSSRRRRPVAAACRCTHRRTPSSLTMTAPPPLPPPQSLRTTWAPLALCCLCRCSCRARSTGCWWCTPSRAPASGTSGARAAAARRSLAAPQPAAPLQPPLPCCCEPRPRLLRAGLAQPRRGRAGADWGAPNAARPPAAAAGPRGWWRRSARRTRWRSPPCATPATSPAAAGWGPTATSSPRATTAATSSSGAAPAAALARQTPCLWRP
jgi:hypothetical protein